MGTDAGNGTGGGAGTDTDEVRPIEEGVKPLMTEEGRDER